MILNNIPYRLIENTTFEHDLRVKEFLVANGLYLVEISQGSDFDADVFARELIAKLIKNATGVRLLSLLLVPEDVKDLDWTLEVGEATFKALMACNTAEDKRQIEVLMVNALTGFFVSGLVSLKISR